jgi:hypothetical protein
MRQSGIGVGHRPVEVGAAGVADPVAAVEPRGQAGVVKLDQVGMIGRMREHVRQQHPEPVAADILAETADHHAAPRPFDAFCAAPRQCLRDIVDGGIDRIARAPLFLDVEADVQQRLVEPRGGGTGAAMKLGQRQVYPPGPHGGDQREQRGRRLAHRIARRPRDPGIGEVLVDRREQGRRGQGRQGVVRSTRRRIIPIRRYEQRRALLPRAQLLQRARPKDRLLALVAAPAHRLGPRLTHHNSICSSGQSPDRCRPSAGEVASAAKSGDCRSSSK